MAVISRYSAIPSTSKRNGLAAVFSASCTETARPSRVATRPQHSFGASRRACAITRSSRSRAMTTDGRSGRAYSARRAGRSSSSSRRRSPLMDSLNSRRPLPTERPTSGSFLGPRTMSAIARTTTSSMGPMLGMWGVLFYRWVEWEFTSPYARARRSDAQPALRDAAPLPPDRGLEVLHLVHRQRVDAARQVLPAVVADDEDDVALVHLAGDPDRHTGDRARRDAREQALLVEQLARPDHGVAVGHEDLAIQQAEVDDRRDEPVVQ